MQEQSKVSLIVATEPLYEGIKLGDKWKCQNRV